MEGKIEWGAEVALSLILCDRIETVVKRGELVLCWYDEEEDLVVKIGVYLWWEEWKDLRVEVVFSFEEKDRIEALV